MDDEKRVREAIEAIALNPSGVGLTHAKILLDEIIRLRSKLAALVRVTTSAQCGQHIPGHNSGTCTLPAGHQGYCEEV